MEQNYFLSFMEDVKRDLKKNGEAFVFSEEQVSYIKEKFKNIKVIENNGIFYITILKEYIDKK